MASDRKRSELAGMRKFARPDLPGKYVPDPWPADNPLLRAAGHLLNTLAEHLCLGTVIGDSEPIVFPGARRRCSVIRTLHRLTSCLVPFREHIPKTEIPRIHTIPFRLCARGVTHRAEQRSRSG